VGTGRALASLPLPILGTAMSKLLASFRSAPTTHGLLVLLGAMYLAGPVVDALVGGDRVLLVLGANAGPLVIEYGQWWRPLTAALLHAGLLHLLMNGWALLQLGRLCEWTFGSATTLALFVFTALTGSALSLFNEAFSVGASGAIFGLEGGLVSFFLRHRDRLTPAGVSLLKQLLAWSFFMLVFGFVTPNIDWRGHLGGLVGGLAVGWVLPAHRGRESRGARMAAVVAALLLVVALVGMVTGGGTLRGPGRLSDASLDVFRGTAPSVVRDRGSEEPRCFDFLGRSPPRCSA
jgi:rhomboid protease GluP